MEEIAKMYGVELGDIVGKFLESQLCLRIACICGVIEVAGIRRYA